MEELNALLKKIKNGKAVGNSASHTAIEVESKIEQNVIFSLSRITKLGLLLLFIKELYCLTRTHRVGVQKCRFL